MGKKIKARPKLRHLEVLAIKKRLKDGEKQLSIAAAFYCSEASVSRIKHNHPRKRVYRDERPFIH